MTFDLKSSEPLEFRPNKLGTVKPPLAKAEGNYLTPGELANIFGIDAQRFAELPKRMIIPSLNGGFFTENWYSTKGWLYVVEPVAWVPQVAFGRTMPVSEFKTEYKKTETTKSSQEFNASTEAEVIIESGGSFWGISASAKSTTKVGFEYSSKSESDETVVTNGTAGNVPIHQVFIFPKLRCKIIKKQRIDYTINDSSKELKWTPDSYNSGYWDERWVSDKRLQDVRQLTIHPVPMEGNGLGHKAYMFPVPQITSDGNDIDVTTLMSRTGWIDWYHYDVPWKEGDDDVIDLAAPRNSVAFSTMATWTTLDIVK